MTVIVRRSSLLAGVSLALLFCTGGAALAADAAPAESPAPDSGDIVVTAQHRAERLDKVGITMDAFDGDRLREAGATTVRDLAFYTPNLAVHLPFGENSYPEITLRGMSADNFNESSPQTTGVYVDGVYQSSAPMLAFQMFDQERVEVLKGPQGTLYGRNTTAGAVNFISRQPTFNPEGYVQADYGRYDYTNFEGAFGGPLIGDSLAGRFAAKIVRQWGGPQVDPTGGDNKGQVDTAYFRGSLLYQDGDKLRISLVGHGGFDKSDSWPYVEVAALVPKGQPNAGQICPQWLAGDMAGANANCVDASGYHKTTKSPYDNPRSLYGKHDDSTYGGVTQIDYKPVDAVKVTSVTAYDHLKRREGLDEDGGMGVVTDTVRGSKVDQFSQELRIASDTSGPFSWIVGGYYSWDRLNGSPIFISNFADWFGASTADYEKLTTQTGAIFGQADYKVTDKLKLTAGIRETWVHRHFDYTEYSIPTGGTASVAFAGTNHMNQSDWSGKVGVDYTPTDHVLLYASVSRGFDAGTFNSYFLGSQAALEPTKQETVTAYEIGFKTTVMPGLWINGAAFYNRWKDIILTEIENRTGVNAPYLANGKGADIAGGELEINWRPMRGLTLSGGGSYTYQKLDDLFEQNLFGTIVNLKGGRLANSPKWTFNGTARYEMPLSETYKLVPQFDVKYESRMQRDVLDTKILQTPPHALVNGRLALQNDNGWEVALWARNLTNKIYVTEAYQVVGGGYSGFVYNMPRTYGISVSKKF